jgi:penicillin amidase
MAAWLPRRARLRPEGPVLNPHDAEAAWRGVATARDLPWTYDPPEGFLASANNLPARFDMPVSYFFITSERVERLQEQLRASEKLSLDDLSALQRDVTSPASARLKNQLVALLQSTGVAGDQPSFIDRLRAWNGRYDAEDVGPVLFEILLYHVVHHLKLPYRHWNMLVSYLVADLDNLTPLARNSLLRRALAAVARDAARFTCWGGMHRMRIEHVLGRLPLVGRWFRISDYPSSGSRETVMNA